jgi:UTP-glucose-1-phosphate uridylyltransferase
VIVDSALLRLHKTIQAFIVLYRSLHQRLVDPQKVDHNQTKEVEIVRASNIQRRKNVLKPLVRKPE